MIPLRAILEPIFSFISEYVLRQKTKIVCGICHKSVIPGVNLGEVLIRNQVFHAICVQCQRLRRLDKGKVVDEDNTYHSSKTDDSE